MFKNSNYALTNKTESSKEFNLTYKRGYKEEVECNVKSCFKL